jgi:CRISPR/Cas system CSM-associated protein Csm3 (group 7 of RAMP superfamily)
MSEDWREKLGKAYNLKVENKKETKKDWDKELEKYNRPKKNTYHNSRNERTSTGDKYFGNRSNHDNKHGSSPSKIQGSPTKAVATAPYNFVSLTDAILPSVLNEQVDITNDNINEKYADYIDKEGKNSGYIELAIKTLTPCFVGGNGDKFFGPAGYPLIPGSTIRGMVKNIFKIITCGAMRCDEDFTDRHLYFRCMMAPNKMPQLKRLHEYYVSRMSTTNKEGKLVKKNKPGFLFRKQGKYYICSAEMKSIPREKYGYFEKDSKIDWDMRKRKAYCLTGNQRNKQYVKCLSNPDWDTYYEVPDKVIQEYQDDKNRKGVDLLAGKFVLCDGEAKTFTGRNDIDRIVPCFFMRDGDDVQSFGHGRSFRIPYSNSVGAHVPKNIQGETIDYADAVFGRKELWDSRVFFEDAFLDGQVADEGKCAVKPLLGPNPTSFQLYLQQTKGEFPAHWDVDTRNIRGYKMYWHQNIHNEWKDPVKFDNNREKITHEITPLSAGVTFTSRIRFENLSDIELGALMNVFQLGNDTQHIAYKLGQGKSLGMGSVDIKTQLYLAGEKKYTELVNENGWNKSDELADGKEYICSYQSSLGQFKDSYDLVTQQLCYIMDWNNTQKPEWNRKVAMMRGDVQDKTVDPRYVDKALLPVINDIVK